MNIKKQDNGVLLCCGKGRCPLLKKSKDSPDLYSLKDDFGGEVSLTKDQLMVVQEALKALDDI